jgi:hypothetical protein
MIKMMSTTMKRVFINALRNQVIPAPIPLKKMLHAPRFFGGGSCGAARFGFDAPGCVGLCGAGGS